MDEVKEKGFQNVMIVTDKGTKMKVDLVIPCTGLKVNTEAYKNRLGWCSFFFFNFYLFIFFNSVLIVFSARTCEMQIEI